MKKPLAKVPLGFWFSTNNNTMKLIDHHTFNSQGYTFLPKGSPIMQVFTLDSFVLDTNEYVDLPLPTKRGWFIKNDNLFSVETDLIINTRDYNWHLKTLSEYVNISTVGITSLPVEVKSDLESRTYIKFILFLDDLSTV